MWDLINRKNYIQQLEKLKDEHIIKVVTGLRHSGKSTLLEMFAEQIIDSGISRSQSSTIQNTLFLPT